MDKTRKRSRKIKRKNLSLQQRRLRFSIGLALFVFLILLIGIIPARTTLVEYERKAFTESVKTYLFCDENYVYLSSSEDIVFLPEEGTKISGSTLLSENYSITTSEYLLQKIETMEYLLNDPDITSGDLYAGITEDRRLASEYNALMNEAMTSSDAEKTSEYAALLEQAQHDALLRMRALQYVYTDSEALTELRDSYRALIGTPQPLTADNLNFTVFGSVFYSADGYENMMSFSLLDNLDGKYLNRLDGFTPVKQTGEGIFCIKSVSTSRAVAVVRLPSDTELFCRDEALELYEGVCASYDIDREGGYFSFIFRRMDIFAAFPTVELTASDGTLITGRLVKVQKGETEDILFIAVTEGLRELSGKRIFTSDMTVETYRCWVVDRRCVYTDDDRTYVNLVEGSGERIPVEVEVYKYMNGKAYIRVAGNETLSEGDEIMLKGRKLR